MQTAQEEAAEVGFQTVVTVEVTAGKTVCTLTYGAGIDGYYLMVSGADALYSVDGTIVDALRNF